VPRDPLDLQEVLELVVELVYKALQVLKVTPGHLVQVVYKGSQVSLEQQEALVYQGPLDLWEILERQVLPVRQVQLALKGQQVQQVDRVNRVVRVQLVLVAQRAQRVPLDQQVRWVQQEVLVSLGQQEALVNSVRLVQ